MPVLWLSLTLGKFTILVECSPLAPEYKLIDPPVGFIRRTGTTSPGVTTALATNKSEFF